MARIASGVAVSALLRRVNAAGGFGAVLQRGDDTAGAIAIITRDRGETRALERVMAMAGDDRNATVLRRNFY